MVSTLDGVVMPYSVKSPVTLSAPVTFWRRGMVMFFRTGFFAMVKSPSTWLRPVMLRLTKL